LDFDYITTANGGRLCLGTKDNWTPGAGSGNNYLYMGTSTANNGGFGTKYGGTTDNTSIGHVSAGELVHCRIIRDGNTVSYYVNDEFKGTKTADWMSNYSDWSIYFQCWEIGDFTVRNVNLDLKAEIMPSDVNLSVSASQDILSQTGDQGVKIETTVLTASVVDKLGYPSSNRAVVFKKGSNVLDTVQTDENGVASYTYHSAGVGDVTFTIECEEATETYTIEDNLYYNPNEISYESDFTSGDHIIGGGGLPSYHRFDLLDNFELEMEVKTNIDGARLVLASYDGIRNYNYCFGSNRDSSRLGAFYRETQSLAWGSGIARDNNYHAFKFVRSGNTFTAFLDGQSLGTQTFEWWNANSPYTFYFWIWRRGTIYAKNIKLKRI
jgi:hypothetical protein